MSGILFFIFASCEPLISPWLHVFCHKKKYIIKIMFWNVKCTLFTLVWGWLLKMHPQEILSKLPRSLHQFWNHTIDVNVHAQRTCIYFIQTLINLRSNISKSNPHYSPYLLLLQLIIRTLSSPCLSDKTTVKQSHFETFRYPDTIKITRPFLGQWKSTSGKTPQSCRNSSLAPSWATSDRLATFWLT